MTGVIDSLPQQPDWVERPFGRVVARSKANNRPDLQPLSVFLDDGVVPRSSRDDNFNRLGEDMSKYLVVQPGDIVFNKLRTWQGGFGVSYHEGVVSPAYFVCRPTDEVEPAFLHYLLHSSPYLAELTRVSKFMPPSQFDILWDDLRVLPIRMPGVEAQRLIAAHLDHETSLIDALIAKKRQLVEALDQRFQSSLYEMTSDGKAIAVRRLVHSITSGPRGWSDQVGSGTSPFVRSANLQPHTIDVRTDNLVFVDPPDAAEASRSSIHQGDVLIGVTGANTGWVGLADREVVGGYVSQHVALIHPFEGLGEWIAYSLAAPPAQSQLLGGQYGGTKQQLGLDDLRELTITVPSADRRSQLLDRFRRSDTMRREAVTQIAFQIELLRERRQALITAAVTGDFEVPGVTA